MKSSTGSLNSALAVLMLAALVLACSGLDKSSPTPTTTSSSGPAVIIAAENLVAAYEQNEVSADTSYKNKTLEVSGTIETIGKDIVDTPYVALKGPRDSPWGVQCMFHEDQISVLSGLKKGQKVTLVGVGQGKLGNVLLRDCRVK